MRLFLISLIFFVTLQVKSATYNAATANLIDINNAVALASNGDTVNVPAGTATWTSTLFIAKNIQLIGAGIGQTIITNGVGGGNGVMFQWTTSTNGVMRFSGFTLTDPITVPYLANGCVVLNGFCDGFRIDHIRWQDVMQDAGYISGANFGVIDHCQIINERPGVPAGGFFMLNGATGGSANGSFGGWGDYSYATNCPMIYGTTNKFVYVEDCSFSYESESASSGAEASDGKVGSRFVYRYCMLTNANLQTHGTDGRERGARGYEFYNNTIVHTGSYTNSGSPFYLCSGSGVIFSNNLIGWGPGGGLNGFVNYRSVIGRDIAPAWGGANGTSTWDLNTNGLITSGTHTLANILYQITSLRATNDAFQGRELLYLTITNESPVNNVNLAIISGLTGTNAQFNGRWALAAQTGTNWTLSAFTTTMSTNFDLHAISAGNIVIGNYFLEDTNANWTPGQFANSSYKVQNIDEAGGTNSYSFGLIITNTATRIYYHLNPFVPQYGQYRFAWQTGERYRIYQTFRALDQPGSGNGDLIADTFPGNAIPINTVTGSPVWPRQTIDPIYIWGNTLNGSPVDALVNYGFVDTGTFTIGNYNDVKLGIDYLNATKPGYTPLVHPHPLVQTNSPAPPVTGNLTTVGRIYF